ncbi:TPA: protein transport protein HofC [Citrobacter freundii]
MPAKALWQWQGIDASGHSARGIVWAENRAALAVALTSQSITPLRSKRLRVENSQWRAERCAGVIQQLATLLKAGLTLCESLTLIAAEHPSRQWSALLRTLAHELEQGVALSVALAQWPQVFPPLYQAMIRTGELSGKLEECCFELARQQKAQQLLTDKVKKALRYPLIILAIAMVVLLAMLHLVLPEFAAIYRMFNTPLPALTQGMIALAQWSARWGGLLALAGAVTGGVYATIRKKPSWLRCRQYLLLRCPLISRLVRGQKLTQIFTILSLTQNAGIPFLQGLASVAEALKCPYWSGCLDQVHREISAGKPIWLALKQTGEFSPLCIQLVMTGEASGSLDLMLSNLARHHREATLSLADNLAALLEPALLIITGVIIGTLVVAMYLPVFQLGNTLSAAG